MVQMFVRKGKASACWLCILALITLPFPLLGGNSAEEGNNPIAKVWRKAREGVQGYSAVTGQEANELIQGSGQNWRQLRNGPVATYAIWLLGITISGIAGFFLIRGRVKLSEPRSGEKVLRWSAAERLLHWLTAIIFLLLAITGLSLLYGREVLIPIVGKTDFAAYAAIAKTVHNITGPAFFAALMLMIIIWFKDNLPSSEDFQWIKDFGGMIGNKHPSAGRMNAGEKIWFWLLGTAGIMVCISGLILDFPNFGQDRLILQLAHLIHVILGIILVVGALGHIYIGTIGTEGPFEGMISGKVDSTWAKQHHDLWYAALQDSEPDHVSQAAPIETETSPPL